MEPTNATMALQGGDTRGAPAGVAEPACPQCAQAETAGRLSMAAMASLVGKHLKLERGLLHTLMDLTLRPGAMLRGYFTDEISSAAISAPPDPALSVTLSATCQPPMMNAPPPPADGTVTSS